MSDEIDENGNVVPLRPGDVLANALSKGRERRKKQTVNKPAPSAAQTAAPPAGESYKARYARIVREQAEREAELAHAREPEPEEQREAPKVGEEESGEEAPESLRPDLALPQPELRRAAAFDNMQEFKRHRCMIAGLDKWRFWRGEFWAWDGSGYARMSEDKVKKEIWTFLDGARARVGDGSARFQPNPGQVTGLLDALRAGVFVDEEMEPPRWFGEDRGSAKRLVTFHNGLVDALTGEWMAATPEFWSHGSLAFDYEPRARCPRFEGFLVEVFPGDEASAQFVSEWLGYCMTWETGLHKIALLYGEPRGGKSTIAWLLEQLGGSASYVGLNVNNWTGENSAADIIGKKNLCFPDMRLKPAKEYGKSAYDPGGMDHKSLHMMLSISGEDKTTVGVKWEKFKWSGRVPGKINIISNNIPNFNDASGAMDERLVLVQFTQNFERLGRKDPELKEKLRAELPGIANYCLRAYRRMMGRGVAGAFIQPASGEVIKAKIAAQSGPYPAFFASVFEWADGEACEQWIFYPAFRWWCERMGQRRLLETVVDGSALAKKLAAEVDGWTGGEAPRPHGTDRRYAGIRYRGSADLDAYLAAYGATMRKPKQWPPSPRPA
jgi:putative DNA primase/helicase